MKIYRVIWVAGMLIIPVAGLTQASFYSLGIWQIHSLTGEVDLKGQFRQLESNFPDAGEDQRSTYLIGGIKLNTRSSLWDPDVIQIDLNGEYSPETRDEKYIALPDRSEVRTLKKMDLSTIICNNKPVTLQAFFNLDQNYFNRELLTNVRSNNRQYGGMLLLNNRVLPITVTYRNTSWQQEETETGRAFHMDQESLQARASKSFGSRDRHEIIYSRNNYLYRYAGLHRTDHLIDRLGLNNSIYFDRARRYNLNSRITWHKQAGTNSYRRFEVLESLSLQLPQHVRLTSNFDLYNLNDPIQTWDQARTRIGLQHKLYQSLTTRLYVEYARVNQQAETLLQETDLRGGIDLRYTKKIPTGTLNLSYRYYRHGHRTEGIAASLNVLNELQTLRDGQLTLLNKPYVETGTVVIKDVTGTRIYQEDFDFLIIQRGSFTEIRRIPGGQIPDQGEIYVDYVFRQPGSYSYGANNNHFSASILLFKQLLEIYYRYSVQDYPNVEQGDLLTLNFYSQHVYGLRLDLGFMRGGVESDVYDSNIIPYRMMRYYMDMNWNIKSRILLNFNGSIRDYTMIDDEVDQLYSNLSGKIAYKIRSSMQVSLQSGYLDQSGLNIDLELLTARAEFQSVFRKLHLRAGLEMYRRMYRDSEFAFNGLYLQLTRRF